MQQHRERLSSTLLQLGFSPKYCGYHAIVAAVELLEENPERISSLVKEVYTDIARKQNRSWRNIERNIRYASANAWKANPQLMQQFMGHPLTKAPSNTEFLVMLYLHSNIESAPDP